MNEKGFVKPDYYGEEDSPILACINHPKEFVANWNNLTEQHQRLN